MKRKVRQACRLYQSVLPIAFFPMLVLAACGEGAPRPRVPSEVQELITRIGEQIAQEQYEQIYNESSERWKQDVTLEKSNEVFKTLRAKLGKIESRSLTFANEQENSGGTLKGHVFILSYRTRFERGEAGETFTLIEENGQWRLARYLVNSTALEQ
jgi:hypothetical protein